MPGPSPHVKSKEIDGERMYWYGDCGLGAETGAHSDAYRAGFDRVFSAECAYCHEIKRKSAMRAVMRSASIVAYYVCDGCNAKHEDLLAQAEMALAHDDPTAWADPGYLTGPWPVKAET